MVDGINCLTERKAGAIQAGSMMPEFWTSAGYQPMFNLYGGNMSTQQDAKMLSNEENYAVNILDMTDNVFDAGPLNMAGLMVSPVTTHRRTVEISSKNVDEIGVVLECDDERAKAIIYLLNKHTLVRAYKRGPRGGWSRITKSEIDSY
jgi:hypothetical protein